MPSAGTIGGLVGKLDVLHKSYGNAGSLDAAKAAFKAEYERGQRERR
jgi:hypothetical protein